MKRSGNSQASIHKKQKLNDSQSEDSNLPSSPSALIDLARKEPLTKELEIFESVPSSSTSNNNNMQEDFEEEEENNEEEEEEENPIVIPIDSIINSDDEDDSDDVTDDDDDDDDDDNTESKDAIKPSAATERKLSDFLRMMADVQDLKAMCNTFMGVVGQGVVKLNVGGREFTSSVATLTRIRNSVFAHRLTNTENNSSPFSYLYLDRCPEHFELILNFLRGVNIRPNVQSLNECQLSNLIDEIMYYRLDAAMLDLLPPQAAQEMKGRVMRQFDAVHCSRHLTLSDDRTMVKKMGGSGCNWNACVLGEGGCQFRIKLLNRCGYMMVGFATSRHGVKLDGQNFNVGYYVFTRNGTLFSEGVRNRYYCQWPMLLPGSIVEGRFENGQISFVVNGVDRGVAFSNIPSGEKLVPAFNVHDTNCRFEIL